MNLFRTRARPLAAAQLLVALFTLAASAHGAALEGRLVDRESRRPVESASVRLLENGRAQRTDASGRFRFDGLAPGAYTLATHHIAYADAERVVGAGGGAGDSVVVMLDPALYRASEVVVHSTRSRSPLGSTPWAAGVMNAGEMRETPAVTVSDAAGRLPGAALSRDGAWETALSIRGLGRSNVVALVDNARIETATDLSGGLSLVNPRDLERVEVMKSSGSVLFGSGSLGGAIHMVTRRAAFSDRPRAGAEWTEEVTSVNRGVSHYLAGEHSGARHALRVSAGYRNAGVTRTPAGPLANSQFRDYSGCASLGLRTAGEQTLTASYQRSQAEDAGIPGGSPFSATATATYKLARRELFGLEYAMPNLARTLPLVTARLSRQSIRRDVDVVQNAALRLTPSATHTTTSGQLEARVAPGGEHLLVAGAELWHRGLVSTREKRFVALDSLVGERPVPTSAYMSGGVYAQDDWNAVPGRVRVVLGARYDRSRTHNDFALNPDYVLVHGVPLVPTPGQKLLWPSTTTYDESWSANAGVRLALSPHASVTALFATAFRSPSLEERFQFIDLGSSLHVGNPQLGPERSVSLNLGGRLDIGRTRLRVDAFGNRLTDLVAETPGAFEGRTANVFVKTNIGRARLYGFEAAGEQQLVRGAAVDASLAYVRGEDTLHHTNLPQVAPLTGRAALTIDEFSAGTLRLTFAAAHTQGNPAAGETRTPGYTALGANFASRRLDVCGGACTLRAGVENLLDRAYRLHLSTLRGLVKLEPGRSYFLSATVEL